MKAVLHYVVLVGTPILGILAILQLGQRLVPPVAVRGHWLLEGAAGGAIDAGCSMTNPQELDGTLLTIAQSGTDVTLSLDIMPGASLSGFIEGTTVQAQAQGELAIQSDGLLPSEFRAELNREAEPDQLEGQLFISRCGQPISVTASRLASRANADGGH